MQNQTLHSSAHCSTRSNEQSSDSALELEWGGKYTNNLALGVYAVGVNCVQSSFSEINIGSD